MPKTPISYYGGKQSLLSHILPLIPEHRIYTEAFFGGGAVFFAKTPSESEIINDIDSMVVNFYRVVKTDFDKLQSKVVNTLFSRVTYVVAKSIYRIPHLFEPIQQAWAFYVATNMGFSCNISSWGYDKYGKRVASFRNKKLAFDTTIVDRLENTQIESHDACKVIESRDTIDTFHYVDPPYVSDKLPKPVDQGHYSGYTEKDFARLLDTLSKVKGKFMLSSYPSTLLDRHIQRNGWHVISIDKPLTASKGKLGKPRTKRKTELLITNYPVRPGAIGKARG